MRLDCEWINVWRYGMGMYEEIDKETMELLLSSLAERTLSGKQEWEGLEYRPVSFARENEGWKSMLLSVICLKWRRMPLVRLGEKLGALKLAGQQVKEALAKGEISLGQYDALQREIVETEQALRDLERQAEQSSAGYIL